MIYITGDTHGGFQRFGSKYFPQQKQMGLDDYVIICGDFGGLWDGSPKDKHWLDWLAEKPFTTLFVDGNHENFALLNALPEKEWHGGRVHEVRQNILHLMRGQVFTFGGLTWFTMGGASSHDIQDGVLDPEAPDFERAVLAAAPDAGNVPGQGTLLVGGGTAQRTGICRGTEKSGRSKLESGLHPDPLRSHPYRSEDQPLLWKRPAHRFPGDGRSAMPVYILVLRALPRQPDH